MGSVEILIKKVCICLLGFAAMPIIAQPAWVLSGSALGDTSIWQYPPTSLTLTLNPTGEALTANTFAGSPTGAHVYGINSVPSVTTGIVGLGTNNKYFGVFVVGGTNPTYSVIYDYTNSPYISISSYFELYKRNNNASSPWVAGGAANVPNTLTLTGEPGTTGPPSRGEYIVGTTTVSVALPIELLYFKANLADSKTKVNCTWATATEINSDYFIVEKTQDGTNYSFVSKVPGAGNSTITKNYGIVDPTPYNGTSYYRLKQVDFNGKYTYSQLEPINLDGINIISIFPNPSVDHISYLVGSKEATQVLVKLFDEAGRLVLHQEENIDAGITKLGLDISEFAAGNYFLQVITANSELAQKQFLVKNK